MSGKASGNGTSSPNPDFVMKRVKYLFESLTSPESAVRFDTQARATPITIQDIINPPTISWAWTDAATRLKQSVTASDVGKFGLETDTSILYSLTSLVPDGGGGCVGVWASVQSSTIVAWTWADSMERLKQAVVAADIGKFGLQKDVQALFKLTAASPVAWQLIDSDSTTSAPFELSTGASDATAYHDFYRMQIAFEDVWMELLDANMVKNGAKLYAQYDTLMAPDDNVYHVDDTGNDMVVGRGKVFAAPPLIEVDGSGNPVRDANGDKIPLGISGAAELQDFIDFLKVQFGLSDSLSPDVAPQVTQLREAVYATLQGCDMLLREFNRAGQHTAIHSGILDGHWLTETSPNSTGMDQLPPGEVRKNVFTDIISNLNAAVTGTTSVNPFPDLINLLKSLDQSLAEPYRFDVFAPDSINFGLVLNYRQRWQPLSYQVGNLISTIPLAPQETRRYTSRSAIRKKRNVREIDDSTRTQKDESSDTSRIDSEIVERAKNQTNFQKNVSGSFGIDGAYKVSAGMQQGTNQQTESSQTKREFHEAVVKSAQEYRNNHRTEISTEESSEDESTSSR